MLDADVWGYSQPRMLGAGAQRPKVSADRKLIPIEVHDGIKVMSIGFFVEQDAAVVWRGPMLHKALTQFLEDVDWGVLDYLLIDLPPGTGDVSMTLAQLLPQAKFLIVTTPQPVAQKVAARSAEMAAKLKLEICGVIENMSGFVTPAGERFQIFGEGGGQLLALDLDVPLLAKVPLTMALREHADSGTPIVFADPDDPASQALRHGARGLIALSPIELPVMQAPAPAAAPPAQAGGHVAADGLSAVRRDSPPPLAPPCSTTGSVTGWRWSPARPRGSGSRPPRCSPRWASASSRPISTQRAAPPPRPRSSGPATRSRSSAPTSQTRTMSPRSSSM